MQLFVAVVLLNISLGAGVDVSGVWDLEMHWQSSNSVSTGVCSLTQVNQKLTGRCEGAKSSIAGEVKDKDVTLDIAVEQDGNKGRMTFAGTSDENGERIEGACRIAGGQEGTFVMKKRPR